MYSGKNDPYVDGSTGILKNLLGITHAKALERAEYDIAYARSSNLNQAIPAVPPFDMRHLRVIHRHRFQDIV